MVKNTNNEQEQFRNEPTVDEFRPSLKVDHVHTYPKELKDPNYIYGLVTTNYKGAALANNFDDHKRDGWEVVYSTHMLMDSRAFTPDNNKSETLRPQPVLKITSCGHQQVLMRIHKDRYNQNELARKKRDDDRYLKAVGSALKKVERNQFGHITEIEIQEDSTINPRGN